MSRFSNSGKLDRYAQVGDLAQRVRHIISRGWLGLIALLGIAVAVLYFTGSPGASAFALIALGTLIALGVWRGSGIGLPILPMLALQNLLVYGLPIVTSHSVLGLYPADLIHQAGVEVLVFSGVLALSWLAGMRSMRPSPAISYALPDFQRGGSTKLKRVGLNLVIAGTLYHLLQKMDALGFLFDLLPTGSVSLLFPLVTAAIACGLFLVSLFIGSGELNLQERVLFWGLLTLACLITASSFLLSGITTLVVAVFTGLFWSTGRIPWRFLVVVTLALAFLNLGKFTMRGRYWEFDGETSAEAGGLTRMPVIYSEWFEASWSALTDPNGESPGESIGYVQREQADNSQSLLQRINNLQNLLFAIDAVELDHVPPLQGKTYSLIPPLLVPRIMWPDKPRSHEGQVLLNVHFGRQDLNSTHKTYVAWGLIPEAYGNFGAYAGSIILGAFLGFSLAWLECLTARKLLLSLEGFVSFTVLLGMVNSFEMVASVLVTTIFQSIVPIVFVSLPFLRRVEISRPASL